MRERRVAPPSSSFSSSRRSRARRARSARSPTSCSAICATSASSRTRTAAARRSARRWGTSTSGSSRRPQGRRSSSARTSTRCRRPGRSSPSSRTASCGTPAARSSARTTSRPSSQMLEGVRRVLAENRPHAGIELLFTPKEEVGLIGAYAFDHDRLHARASATSTTRRRRSARSSSARRGRSRWRCSFHGRAAHSGMFPEEGRSAIQAAAKAIADLRLGRVDEETTANVGVISRRHGREHRPRVVHVPRRGARRRTSASSTRSCRRCSTRSRSPRPRPTARSSGELRKSYHGYRFKRDDDVVQLAATALERCGYEPTYALSGGGADANVFNERGRRCVNLANGMTDIHTPDERIAVADLDGDGRRDARARRRRARGLMEERRLGPVVGLGTWNTFGADAALAGERRRRGARRRHARSSTRRRCTAAPRQSLAAALASRRARRRVATKIWAPSVDEGREQYRRQRRMVRPRRDRADPQPRARGASISSGSRPSGRRDGSTSSA